MLFTREKKPQAFTGYPKTRLRRDWRGREWHVVNIRHLTPFWARVGDHLGTVSAPALALGALYTIGQQDQAEWWVWAAGLIAPFALVDVWRMAFRRLLRRTTRVKLNRDDIKIGRRSIPRHLVTGFTAEAHPQKLHEQEENAHKMRVSQRRKGKPERIRSYFGDDTCVIVCGAGPRTTDVCTVVGLADRRAILARLNGVNDALNGDLGVGIGIAITTAADTAPGRGGIPE